MTLAKPTGGTEVLTNKSAAAGGTTATLLADCTSIDTTNAIQVSVEVVATYDTPSLGGRLEVFGSQDNTNWSTQAYAAYDMVKETGATRQVFGVANAPRYLKFRVMNLDTTKNITGIYINAAMQTVT